MNFRKPSFQDSWHCCEVLQPALGPWKSKLSHILMWTDFCSGPQFTGKPAGPSLESDQWDKEEKSYLDLISSRFVTNGKGGCAVAQLLNSGLCYVGASFFSPKLCQDHFTKSTCWKAFLEKKANNVFCRAAEQPLRETALWLYSWKERENWILTTIPNPSPKGSNYKKISASSWLLLHT